MFTKALFVSCFCCLFPFVFFGQFRKLYLDSDASNHIKNINFITAATGYISFQNWIGYTQDSGRTFSKKYISINNVDYNGYNANLTFGFGISGVYIYNKDSILVYGDYGFVPSILLSSDGGNTFKLIYNSTLNLSTLNQGIQNIVFPGNASTGFAVETNRILKSVDRGRSWVSIFNDVTANFTDIDFKNISTGFAINGNKLLKTTNGGQSWQSLTVPSGYSIVSMSFINPNTGWINIDQNIYYTNDGGSSWQVKNNMEFYPVHGPITFENDSTGYVIGGAYTIYKTTDSGKIWEPLPRDNSYSYLLNSHQKLFFLNPDIVWAGGGHGFLELSTNGGGVPLPYSIFKADLSSLNSNSTIILNNYSKTGYQYKWLKNSVEFATTYNASYVSSRLTIDTIKLIVIKGAFSDTSQTIIDTRVNTQKCFATFQTLIDTGSVKVVPGYTGPGVNHYWHFGDGRIDSINESPVHLYKTIGQFTIKHKVYNTIDKCTDSITSVVNIIRTQNCLSFDFTYTADSFYTNIINFKPIFDSTKESGVYPEATWQFGDNNTSNQLYASHTYDSAKYYNTCLSVKNHYTGCVTTLCKPVQVQMNTTCNATFLIRTYMDEYGYLLSARTILFNGALSSQKKGKRHTWIINDRDTTVTGNAENFQTGFFTTSQDIHFDVVNNGCGYGTIYKICIDSLDKKITHIIYDSITGCTDSSSEHLTVPRQYTPFIKAVTDPLFPANVSFFAYTGTPENSRPYSSVWRVGQGDGGGYYVGDYNGTSNKLPYTFSYPGTYIVAIAAPQCSGGFGREVYYINYTVAPFGCRVYPPDFSANVPDTTNPMTLQFADVTYNQNSNFSPSSTWYFGDGDSSHFSYQSSPRHTYASPGVYSVTLILTAAEGCNRKITKLVTVLGPCLIKPAFSVSRNDVTPSRISFINSSTSSSDSLSYTWYFGDGDSSTEKNPVHNYKLPGSFTVKLYAAANGHCVRFSDTTIIISTKDICNLNAGFSRTIEQNKAYFKNTSMPDVSVNSVFWDFGDGLQDTAKSPIHTYGQTGEYKVCMQVLRDGACQASFCDTAIITSLSNKNILVIPNPVNGSFIVQYTSQISEQVVINIINSQGTIVQSMHQDCHNGSNKYSLNAGAMQKGFYMVRITGESSGSSALTSFLKL